MEKFNGEQTEPIKITSAIEDIIEVIKRNDKSEIKVDLLLLAEEKLKKETDQRFIAHRVGKIEIMEKTLELQSFFIRDMFRNLKKISEPMEYDKMKQNFLNIINS